MTDPGQWNRYSYSAGDPINSLDPEGLLVIKINGAFNGDPDWIKADSEFSAAVAATFPGQTIVSWSWPGWGVTQLLAYSGIYAAGDALAAFINSYQYAPGEALNIVAFSDGGNVAKVASWKISRPIDNLVTLGTPQNWDLPDIYRPRVKNYCNVSSLADPVQFAGSSLNQIYNTIVDAYDAGLAQFYGWQAFFAGNYSAFGYYQRVSALLAARSTAWMMTTRIDPYANHNVLRTTDSHFGLHTRQVWNEIKRPCGL